ncbi:CBBY-LIKE PROTEIN [Salix viminalis]|uniref:CBBY-LIKE PROTEIN n=1 Tax=Salix viminalis TaxID=40686 RepID=A0A9Q0NV78_SALVM|nr:CBBY-LIKE PROTEIN [Salix viminalis]
MASSSTASISLSLATLSSTTATASSSVTQTKTSSICSFRSHERTLSSSLLGTRIRVCNKTARTKVVDKSSTSNGITCLASSSVLPSALLFDCDGVLVDTEKDGHRISFNDTFNERELGVTWDVDLYGELLKIGGGKERMTAYFNKTGWPEKAPKSVAKLIDQALGKGVKVAVCSTSNEKAVSAIVSFLLGPERSEKIKIFAGDVVPRKKPDPAKTLGVDPSSCVVVEDSAIGLAAAKAAGMKCIVTKERFFLLPRVYNQQLYTADEDFLNADAVFDCIGDPPEECFDLAFCGSLLEKQYVS